MSPAPSPVSADLLMSEKMDSRAGTAAAHLLSIETLPEPSRTKSMYTGSRVACACAVAQPASRAKVASGAPPLSPNAPTMPLLEPDEPPPGLSGLAPASGPLLSMSGLVAAPLHARTEDSTMGPMDLVFLKASSPSRDDQPTPQSTVPACLPIRQKFGLLRPDRERPKGGPRKHNRGPRAPRCDSRWHRERKRHVLAVAHRRGAQRRLGVERTTGSGS